MFAVVAAFFLVTRAVLSADTEVRERTTPATPLAVVTDNVFVSCLSLLPDWSWPGSAFGPSIPAEVVGVSEVEAPDWAGSAPSSAALELFEPLLPGVSATASPGAQRT